MRRPLLTRHRLDHMVVDIELLLIAVVQGLALTTLATKSEVVIGELEWLYWPYVIAGVLVLAIVFWILVEIVRRLIMWLWRLWRRRAVATA